LRFSSLLVVVVVVLLGRSRLIAVVVDDFLDAPCLLLLPFLPSITRAGVGRLVVLREREMCPWAISKYFGDLVPNTGA
jgi:hypothetical protein